MDLVPLRAHLYLDGDSGMAAVEPVLVSELDARERFSKELDVLLKWLALSKKELRLRKTIEDELHSITAACIPGGKVTSIGSCYTGLCD